MKECGQCAAAGREAMKPVSEFYKRAMSDDGLQLICKECSKLNCAAQALKAKKLRHAKKAARLALKAKVVNPAVQDTAGGAKGATPDA